MAIEFVNRAEELAQIKRLASNEGDCLALYVEGKGGLGKTRLLEETLNLLSRGEHYHCIDVIDFDDRSLLAAENLERRLLKFLADNTAQSVLIEVQESYRMENAGDSQETQIRQRKKIIKALANAFNKQFGNKRMILSFDTVEKLTSEIYARLIEFTSQLRNALSIFAGRPESDNVLWNEIQQAFGETNSYRLHLQPFDQKASREFLRIRERDRNYPLTQNQRELLVLMAGGSPILIDLALQYFIWLDKPTLEWLQEFKPEDFERLSEEERNKYKQDFEKNLVVQIMEIRAPMDRLCLVLSRIYPLNENMIAELLNLSEAEAHALFSEAQPYIFIKLMPGGREITLHDEMRRLIVSYVWKGLDLDGSRQRRDSEIAQKIFKKRDEDLYQQLKVIEEKIDTQGGTWQDFDRRLTLEREREMATEMWLVHALYTNFDAGFREWDDLIETIRAGRKYSLVRRLCALVKPYYETRPLSPEQEDRYRFVFARSEVDTGDLEAAERDFKALLAKRESDAISDSSIFNMLGIVKREQGYFNEALEYQTKCRQLIPDEDKLSIAKVENQLGYLYRLLEDFDRENLDRAIDHYEISLNIALELDEELSGTAKKTNRMLIASVYTNLGYVHGLQQNYSKAETYCQNAVSIWEQEGRNRDIARAETALGILARDQGQYDRSTKLLNRAINRLKDPDDYRELCRAYLHLAWTQWYDAYSDDITYQADLGLLEQSKSSFEQSLDYALKYSYINEQPAIYHQFASVCWVLGKLKNDPSLTKRCRELNQKAVQLSHELYSPRYMVDSVVGDAEFDLDDDIEDHVQSYAEELWKLEEKGYPFALYYGRMHRILGDFAFKRGNMQTAFAEYAQGFQQINEHGGFGPYSITRELHKLAQKIETLSPTDARTWINYLRRIWGQGGHRDLRFWCEQQIIQMQLRSR